VTVTGLFSRLRRLPATAVRRIGVTVVVVMIGTFESCGLAGVRINASPSLPVGLYLVTARRDANLVEFCPARPFAELAIARGYRDAGSCPDGGAPLLKPVVAHAGDVVELSPGGMTVNGQLLPNTAAMTRDAKNRLLTPWPKGRYTVGPNSMWVASSYNARSFDSRYFGPISVSSIRAYVRPLLTAR
jgi:conjugative transfer signal peptidase TraF